MYLKFLQKIAQSTNLKLILPTDTIALAVISIFNLSIYWSSFSHSFVQDDFPLIASIVDGINLKKILIDNFFVSDFYRPLSREIMFYLSYQLFQMDATGYHAIVFIVFILNAFIVYKIINTLSTKGFLAIICSIFYLTRGAHFTELYWISAGFQETITTFFILCSVLLIAKYYQEKNKYLYIASFIFAFISLLCKESWIILPFIIAHIALYHYGWSILDNWKKFIAELLPFTIILIIYVTRIIILGSLMDSGAYSMSFNAVTVAYNLLFYISNSFNGTLEIIFLLPIILLAFFNKEKWKLIILGTMWFGISLLPYLFLREHSYTYYMSVAFAGPAMLIYAGLSFCQDKVGKNVYLIALFLTLIMLWAGSVAISNQENLSAVTIQETTSNNIIAYLQQNFESFPNNSTIYIKNADQRVYWAMGFDSAIKLYYGKDKTVFYENITEGELPVQTNIYYFYYENNSIRYLDESQVVN